MVPPKCICKLFSYFSRNQLKNNHANKGLMKLQISFKLISTLVFLPFFFSFLSFPNFENMSGSFHTSLEVALGHTKVSDFLREVSLIESGNSFYQRRIFGGSPLSWQVIQCICLSNGNFTLQEKTCVQGLASVQQKLILLSFVLQIKSLKHTQHKKFNVKSITETYYGQKCKRNHKIKFR